MNKRTAFVSLVALVAACDAPAPGADDQSASTTPARIAATIAAQHVEAPEGLVADGPLYQMDVQTREHTVPVRGSRDRLSGVLADADGRRSLRWLDARGATDELAPAAWNLPPVGATSGAGDSLACWSRLTGDDAAGMPHPAQGMELVCRLRTRAGIGPELRLAPGARAAWLQTVTALRDGGFRVVYHADDGWLIGPGRDGHGMWAQHVDAAGVEAPTLLRAVIDPM